MQRQRSALDRIQVMQRPLCMLCMRCQYRPCPSCRLSSPLCRTREPWIVTIACHPPGSPKELKIHIVTSVIHKQNVKILRPRYGDIGIVSISCFKLANNNKPYSLSSALTVFSPDGHVSHLSLSSLAVNSMTNESLDLMALCSYDFSSFKYVTAANQ